MKEVTDQFMCKDEQLLSTKFNENIDKQKSPTTRYLQYAA